MMEPSMEWSMADTLELIDRYREREVLWDTNNPNYKLANERESAWNELATMFRTTPFQVKRKIKSLLASYRRERVKLHKCGSKAEESKWFAFERLSFMKEIYTPRRQHNENEADKADVDLMAELLDVSLREGGVYIEDETESEDHSICVPLTAEYKQTEPNSTNLSSGNYSRKRKKLEELHTHPAYNRYYYPLHEYPARRDELSVYGEHIANELRQLDKRTQCKVKHMINNIIYEAQISSPLVDSSATKVPNVSSRYPDSRLSSPSSTNPSGLIHVKRESTDDSELDDGVDSAH